MSPRPERLCLAFALAWPMAGCNSPSGPCHSEVPVNIHVVDGYNGLSVCDPQITATDGPYVYSVWDAGSTLDLSDAEPCAYTFDPHRAGTFVLTASAPGLPTLDTPETVTLQYGACGFEGYGTTVTLVLLPGDGGN